MTHQMNHPSSALDLDLETLSEDEIIEAITTLRSSRYSDIANTGKKADKKTVEGARVARAGSKAALSIEDLAAAAGVKLSPEKLAKLQMLLAAKKKKT